jgi:hypothetical protein
LHAGLGAVAYPRCVLGRLAESGELVRHRGHQVLGAGGGAVDRLADAALGGGAAALQRRLDGALAAAGLTLDPVAGLARLGRRLAAGRGAAALGPFQRFAQLAAVGLELLLGGIAAGERLDQLADAIADGEDDPDREVDGALGDGLDLALLRRGGLGGRALAGRSGGGSGFLRFGARPFCLRFRFGRFAAFVCLQVIGPFVFLVDASRRRV